MTIENWQTIPGFPPLYVDVLDREERGDGEKCWIRGDHPELGRLHKGYTGHETVVYCIRKDDKLMPIKYMGKEPRYERTQKTKA